MGAFDKIAETFEPIVDIFTGGDDGGEGLAKTLELGAEATNVAASLFEANESLRAGREARRSSQRTAARVVREAEFQRDSGSRALQRLLSSQRAAVGGAGFKFEGSAAFLSIDSILEQIRENEFIIRGATEDATDILRQGRITKRQNELVAIAKLVDAGLSAVSLAGKVG